MGETLIDHAAPGDGEQPGLLHGRIGYEGAFAVLDFDHACEGAPIRCPAQRTRSLRLPRMPVPRAPMTPAEYWDKCKPYKGGGVQSAQRAGRFEWTQYPGHGPGAEVLGRPRRALELGPAEGAEAAHLARQGVEVTGVDLSPRPDRTRAWWKDIPGLSSAGQNPRASARGASQCPSVLSVRLASRS